jgi:hypothetical protein
MTAGLCCPALQFRVFEDQATPVFDFITKSRDLSTSPQLKVKGINHLGTEMLGRASLINCSWVHDGRCSS